MEKQTLGRYEIVGELGRGAMGVVYKAVDPALNRTVAIKTIRLSDDREERDEYEARFRLEAKAAGSLNHPAIVTIYELGSSGDMAYMAMEFLDGHELRTMLTERDSLPLRETLRIAAETAAGLDYAHRHGVVHRDIKPANIIILKSGAVKIADFGIAQMRASDIKTQTGMRLGSPKYMSPEQVLGQRADHRTDIFSLGIVLYEMITGRAPFGGDSLEGLMYQTVNLTPPPPSRINPDVPEMLDLIIAKALEKSRDDRYQNASDMVSDLRECGQCYGIGPQEQSSASDMTASHEATVVLKPEGITARSRRSDGQEDAEEGRRTISPLFDSFEATQRLAAETGMVAEFEAYSATIRLAPATPGGNTLPPAMAKAEKTVPPRTSPPVEPARPAAGSGEWKIAGAILLAAMLTAALIAFT